MLLVYQLFSAVGYPLVCTYVCMDLALYKVYLCVRLYVCLNSHILRGLLCG